MSVVRPAPVVGFVGLMQCSAAQCHEPMGALPLSVCPGSVVSTGVDTRQGDGKGEQELQEQVQQPSCWCCLGVQEREKERERRKKAKKRKSRGATRLVCA